MRVKKKIWDLLTWALSIVCTVRIYIGKIKECIKLKKLGIKSNNIYCCICKNLKPEQNVEKYCTVLTYCNTVVKEEPEPVFFSGAGASLF